jgi:hypothetical protein
MVWTVGANKKAGEEGPTFVVAYLKPELATDQNLFLMGDFSVQKRPSDVAKLIIEEVSAGKNPPPSWK